MDRVLVAVCEVLVLKALESSGRWILREERNRPKEFRGEPLHEAHTCWPPDDEQVIVKALRGAWEVLPYVIRTQVTDPDDIDIEQLMNTLDSYVHDLVFTGTEHTMENLRYRLERMFGYS